MPEKLLAIALDSAEVSLVRSLLAAGRLPSLKRLVDGGTWSDVMSSGDLGSGSVWPTFITGQDPLGHGIFSEWLWDPEAMAIRRFHPDELTRPFWKDLSEQGVRVGIFDVPLAPVAGLPNSFEVCEWGAHSVMRRETAFGSERARKVVEGHDAHPWGRQPWHPEHIDDLEGLKKVSVETKLGAVRRARVARALIEEFETEVTFLAFQELHHASHYLWHSFEADHPLYASERRESWKEIPSLADDYVTVIEEACGLLDLADADTSVIVFSLHGITPSRGVPTIAEALMKFDGHSINSLVGQGRQGMLTWLLLALKRFSPAWAKHLYHSSLSRERRMAVTQATILEPLDWQQTRAFAIPEEQFAMIRVNLQGREAQGIVGESDYDAVVDAIGARLEELTSQDGRRLISGTRRLFDDVTTALVSGLPDLITGWDAALYADAVPSDRGLSAPLKSLNLTGHHSSMGWAVTSGPIAERMPPMVLSEELHRIMIPR